MAATLSAMSIFDLILELVLEFVIVAIIIVAETSIAIVFLARCIVVEPIALRFGMIVLLAISAVLDKLLHHLAVRSSDGALLGVNDDDRLRCGRVFGTRSDESVAGFLPLRGSIASIDTFRLVSGNDGIP